MPETISTVADSSGSSVIRYRIATIGSSTEPSLPESAAESAHRLRIGDRVPAADEPHAVGLIGDFSDVRPVHGHQVKHPRRLLVEGAGPAGAEDRLPLADDLGLNKEIAERRMQRVRGRRCENDFRVTRDLDRLCASGSGW